MAARRAATVSDLLYFVDRLFGCWLGRHVWSDEWTDGADVVHHVCEIAACQRHEIRRGGKWIKLPVELVS